MTNILGQPIDKFDKQQFDAVIRCVELLGRKNAKDVKQINNNTYQHISMRGKIKTFKCYGYGYSKFATHTKDEYKKLHKVNGYYILELV